ncbi:MAG: 6-phosphogluconolactonase [Armatimonadetes bacterium]|nr:6-phosphogluconolactonase [Armatimonadota bacterium]
MTKPTVVVAPDEAALARLAADYVLHVPGQREGTFRVALSGGRTPRSLYELLASDGYRSAVRWTDWHVFFADERAVPADHPDSNFGMLDELLLSRAPLPPDRVHRMRGEAEDLASAAEDYERELAGSCSARTPSLDLVLLGIGDDGHTASLFSGTEGLREEERWVIANYVPKLGAHRLTLTYPALAASRRVAFLVAGEGKAEVVRRVLAGDGELPATKAAAHPRATFLLDRGAASALGAEWRGV